MSSKDHRFREGDSNRCRNAYERCLHDKLCASILDPHKKNKHISVGRCRMIAIDHKVPLPPYEALSKVGFKENLVPAGEWTVPTDCKRFNKQLAEEGLCRGACERCSKHTELSHVSLSEFEGAVDETLLEEALFESALLERDLLAISAPTTLTAGFSPALGDGMGALDGAGGEHTSTSEATEEQARALATLDDLEGLDDPSALAEWAPSGWVPSGWVPTGWAPSAVGRGREESGDGSESEATAGLSPTIMSMSSPSHDGEASGEASWAAGCEAGWGAGCDEADLVASELLHLQHALERLKRVREMAESDSRTSAPDAKRKCRELLQSVAEEAAALTNDFRHAPALFRRPSAAPAECGWYKHALTRQAAARLLAARCERLCAALAPPEEAAAEEEAVAAAAVSEGTRETWAAKAASGSSQAAHPSDALLSNSLFQLAALGVCAYVGLTWCGVLADVR